MAFSDSGRLVHKAENMQTSCVIRIQLENLWNSHTLFSHKTVSQVICIRRMTAEGGKDMSLRDAYEYMSLRDYRSSHPR